MGKCQEKNKKSDVKKRNLVVSKPENHNLAGTTAIKTKDLFSRKKKHYFFADTKLKVHQIKRKIMAKTNSSISHCLFKNQQF